MEENKKKIVERKLSKEDLERLEILQKSEEIKGERRFKLQMQQINSKMHKRF